MDLGAGSHVLVLHHVVLDAVSAGGGDHTAVVTGGGSQDDALHRGVHEAVGGGHAGLGLQGEADVCR